MLEHFYEFIPLVDLWFHAPVLRRGSRSLLSYIRAPVRPLAAAGRREQRFVSAELTKHDFRLAKSQR